MSASENVDLQSVNTARNEYLIRLHKTVAPFVIGFIKDLYAGAVQREGYRKAIKETQRLLREVPGWNASVISEKARAIEAREPALPNIIAAAFVSFVKILSSIRLSSERPRIKLKVPPTETFVHRVYVLCAKKVYETPALLRNGTDDDLRNVVFEAVENAVRDMIPMGDILPVYLSNTVGQDNTVNPVISPPGSEQGNPDDIDDDDVESPFEDEDDVTNEPPKVIEYGHQPSAPPPTPTAPQPAPSSSLQPPFGLAPSQPAPVHDAPQAFDSTSPPQQQQQAQPLPSPPPQPHHHPPQPPQPLSRPLFPDAAEGDAVFG